MVSTKVVFYLLAVCGSLQAVGPRELVAVAATTTPGRRLATGAAFGAGAVAGVYALCRKLLSSKMVDSAVQTDGPTSQQIVAWLDDIVAKANEFLPQRQIIADLSEIREKKEHVNLLRLLYMTNVSK